MSFNLNTANLTFEVFAKGQTGLLVESGIRYKRDSDGNPTKEVDCAFYNIVLPKNGYQQMTVKVPNESEPIITNDMIASNGGAVEVVPKDFTPFIYSFNGRVGLSAKASAIMPVAVKKS